MRKPNKILYDKIIAKWDELSVKPENRYLRKTPKANKVAAILDVSYPTVIKVLIEAGRYTKQ